jgi:hypothetical protein
MESTHQQKREPVSGSPSIGGNVVFNEKLPSRTYCTTTLNPVGGETLVLATLLPELKAPISQDPDDGRGFPFLSAFSAAIPKLVKFVPAPITGEPGFGAPVERLSPAPLEALPTGGEWESAPALDFHWANVQVQQLLFGPNNPVPGLTAAYML